MPRSPRVTTGGYVYHVLNRANARMTLFESAGEYEMMLSVLAEAHERVRMRTLGYCVMPNHWHLLLWPRSDGDLPAFMGWLTMTHTQRWHVFAGMVGTGHVYQGRYKSFPVQQTRPSRDRRERGMLEGGDAVLSVLRYIERNPLRAGLVTDARDWAYSSLYVRAGEASPVPIPLTAPPGGLPDGWAETVNLPQSEKELQALDRCVKRGCPFGREPWMKAMAAEWGLESTLRPRGRPKKEREKEEKGSWPLKSLNP